METWEIFRLVEIVAGLVIVNLDKTNFCKKKNCHKVLKSLDQKYRYTINILAAFDGLASLILVRILRTYFESL